MSVFLTSIQSIIPIIVIIVLGYILQTRGWFADSFGGNLSRLIMNVALPVSIFVSVLKYLTVDKLVQLSGGLLYTNTFDNANTIFIGLPLNVALFGDEALPYFLIYYITNTISTWTLGVYLMTSDSKNGEKKAAQKFNWKKLLPAPLVGFLVALVFLLLRIPVPPFASSTLTYIGNLVTPLSLIYIGIILAKAGLGSIHLDKDTVVTLVGRFVLAPVIMYLLLVFLGKNLPAQEFKTFVVQAAAPALAVLPILATQGDGDVEFSTNIVTISTVLFVAVVPIVVTLLG